MQRKIYSYTALVIIMILFVSTANKSFIRLSFEVNKLEIIEKFCINKEEKAFSCEGKCHLKTQLDITDSSEPFKENKMVEEFSMNLLCASFKNPKFKLFSSNVLTQYFKKAEYFFLFSNLPFKPPKRLS